MPATKSFEITGNMNHTISRNMRARARLEYFSDVITQQLYYQDVYKATRNNRADRRRSDRGIRSGVHEPPLSEKRVLERRQQLHHLR